MSERKKVTIDTSSISEPTDEHEAEAGSPSTSSRGKRTSSRSPSTFIHDLSTSIHGQTSSFHGPSTSTHGQTSSFHGPSTSSYVPSTGQSTRSRSPRTSPKVRHVEDIEDEYPVISAKELLNTKKFELSEQDLIDIKLVSNVYWYGKGALKLEDYEDDQGNYLAVTDDHIRFRYRVRHGISKGSFSSVLKAYDCKEKKEVAIKIFRKTFEISANQEHGFLQHLEQFDPLNIRANNIVRAFGYFTFRQHSCIVLELLGDDLTVLIDEHPDGVEREIMKQIVKSILFGLHYLHECEVIHTDLKPSNVAQSGDQHNYKIIDLGLAIHTKDAEKKFLLVQAHAYRAPEVFLHAPYSLKIDIFALGLITVELATGKRLFQGSDDCMQMANYVEVLGLPPRYVVDGSKNSARYFTVTPTRIHPKILPRIRYYEPGSKTLEDFLNIKNEPLLIDFMKKCLDMDPAKRFTAEKLLEHAWLKK